ncbi:hypothetical protein HDV03_005276 [Kappamyces sp. JEL0829]|nr:hypothetical protein HDV03_005276 [Kappamyces sp. JEL0829]
MLRGVLLATFAHAATIAQLLAADASLSQVAAQASSHPEWSQPGKITVFAPTNAAIAQAPAGALSSSQVGVLTSSVFIPVTTTYAIVTDIDGVSKLVYNNGAPGQTSPPAIEIRYGLASGSITSVLTADNGILYISNNLAIAPPGSVSKTLEAIGCFKFLSVIATAGISSFVDGLNGVTIFAPNDDAYQAIYSPVLSKLSPAQLRAVVFYHIVPQVMITNNMPSGSFSTLLANNSLAITVNNEGVMLPGATTWIFDQADNFAKGAVIQRLSFYLNPPNLPSSSDPVAPANVPQGSSPYVAAATTSVSVTSYSPKPTGASQSSGDKRNHEVMPNFVLESNGIGPGDASSMAFWEDIVNVLSLGTGDVANAGLENVQEIYSQLPPAEMKTSPAIQSNVNIQKPTLRLSRLKESSRLQYGLSFKYDTLKETKIKIYWGAKELPTRTGDELSYSFVDKNGHAVEPWEFGPYQPGLNLHFTLPDDYTIDNALLKQVGIGWVSELDLLSSPVIIQPGTSDIASPATSASTSSPLLSPTTPDTVVQVDAPSPRKQKTAARATSDPYHLVIVLESVSSGQTASKVDSQYTFANFSSSNDRQLEVHYSKQLLIIDGMSFVLQDIFGFAETQSTPNHMSQKECVVCMADVKNTLVLPCRHLCLCTECAELLRNQGRTPQGQPSRQGPPKCPICRQVFHSLISISLPEPYCSNFNRSLSVLPTE